MTPPPSIRPGVVSAAVGVVATLVLGLGGTTGSLAAFTDSSRGASGTLAAHTVPAPATFTCGAIGVLSVTFNWTAVPEATSYTVHFGTNGAQTASTTARTYTILVAVASAGKAWVTASRNYGSTTWTSVASTTRTYNAAVVSTCS